MAVILRKLSRLIAAGLNYAARTSAARESAVWGDGPRPLWTKRISGS
jgi:hypothetical protein